MGAVSQRLNAVDREAQRAFSGFDKLADRLGTVSTAAGTALTAGITAPLGLISAASVSAAGAFETSFNKIQALGDNVTGPALERLRQQALKLGADTRFSAQEAADGMTVFAASGYSTQQILAVMPATLDLAAGGMTSVAEAALITKNTLNQFGLEVTSAGMVADVLGQISKETSASMNDIGLTLKYVGPVAASSGQSLYEVGAAMIALDKAGIDAEKSGTGLRGVLGGLFDPSEKSAAAMKQLEVSVSDAGGKILPLSDIMDQFRVGLAKIGDDSERSRLLFQIFGRESVSTAVTLINTGGSALDQFQQKLENSEGVIKKMADTMNKGLAFSIDQLKGSIETAAITLGTALLPVMTKVLDHGTRLVNEFVIPAAKWFAALSDPVKLTLIAFAGAAAALGPFLFVAGQLAISITALAPAFTSIIGALGLTATAAGTAGAAAATAAGATGLGAIAAAIPPLVLLIGSLGIAWAAWKFQDDIPGIQLLKLAFESVTTAIKLQIDFVKWLAKGFVDLISPLTGAGDAMQTILAPQRLLLEGMKELSSFIRDATSAVRGMRVEVDSLPTASDLAANALKRVNDSAKPLHVQLGVSATKMSDLTKATNPAALAAAKFRQAIEDEKKSIQESAAKMKIHEQALMELGMETEKTKNKHVQFLDLQPILAAKLAIVTSEYKKNEQSIAGYQLRLEQGKVETVNFTTVLSDLQGMVKGTYSEIRDVSEVAIPPFIQRIIALTPPTNLFREALERLGITGAHELQKVSIEAAKARDVIVGSDVSTDFEKKTAIYKALEAQIEYSKVAGINITKEQKRTMENLSRELGIGQKQQKDHWRVFTQQVSTIVSDLGKELASSTINLFKGLFGLDGFNKDLQKQSQEIRAELATRTDDFTKYREATEADIERLTAKYSEQMAQEIADLRAGLAERTVEYQEYVADVTEKLESLRNTEGERLAEEQAKLSDALRDKEAAYQEYQQEVAEKESEIRRSHAERLAEQLQDLRDNLRDKQQAFDDYVTDANTKLSRIGVELDDDIGDITVSINRRMEDENTDFARDQERLNEDIREAELKGDKDLVASLRRQLNQRTEDHTRTIQRLKEDLAEQVDDARRRAEQQTADTKLELDRRTRDHKEYIAENIRTQAEVTEKNRESLNEQLGDLHENLDKRTQELIAFRGETALAIEAAATQSAQKIANAESEAAALLTKKKSDLDAFATAVDGKIDGVTQHYKDKIAEETAALNMEFANKLKEYDTYRTDVEAKLAELEAAHKGPLDRIKEMFGGVATSAANAFLRLASEELWGGIIEGIKSRLASTALGSAFDSFIKSIGEKLSGVFGGAADNIGGAAKTGTGAAGSAGGATSGASGAAGGASGLLGTLTAVGALGSFATGIIGAFQNARQENTLNAIEESTRFTAIGTIGASGIIDSLRQYLPWMENIAMFNYTVAAPWMAHMQSWTEPGGQWFDRTVQMIDLIAQRVVGPLDLLALAITPGADGTSATLNVRVFLDGKELSNAITAADERGGGAL